MPKCSAKRSSRLPRTTVLSDRIRKALEKRTKAELVDVIMEIVREDRGVMRRLESRFGVESPPEELVAATRQAIADATDFDEREINRNFSYDYQAYSVVKRNFGRLIQLGHCRGDGTLARADEPRKLPSRNER